MLLSHSLSPSSPKNRSNISEVSSISLCSRLQNLIIALAVFAVLYTLTNAYSAALFSCCPSRIHTLAFTLDTSIAFIPAMIVPYSWSLILFIASFFMVRTKRQLSVLTSRLLMVTLLASVFFYIYPARFSFVRPLVTDWTAFGYLFLSVTDKPYNQFPSLHVSYALLLGVSLWHILDGHDRWLRIIYRLMLSLVCALIIISTVFTYQHHLLDILGGAILAGVVWIVSNNLPHKLVFRHLIISIAGCLVIAISGFFVHRALNQAIFEYFGIALAMYWLLSFMALAWLYHEADITTNRRWFQKNATGKLSAVTWIAFAPLLLAYKALSLVGQVYTNYQRGSSEYKIAWHPIKDFVNDSINNFTNDAVMTAATPCLGLTALNNPMRLINCDDHEHASCRKRTKESMDSKSVAACQLIVVDVAAEIDSHYESVNALVSIENERNNQSAQSLPYVIYYLYLPLLDLQPFQVSDTQVLVKLFQQLDRLVNACYETHNTAEQIQMVEAVKQPRVLINFHCVMGLSRSVAVQALYLVYCGKLSLDSYQAWIDQQYPNAHLSKTYLPESLISALADVKSLKA